MSQFNTSQVRRSGGGVDVYTGLLVVAFLVLATGVAMLAMANIEHSSSANADDGGVFKLVSP